MSVIRSFALLCRSTLRFRNQSGQATAEYSVVMIVAVALGLAVVSLFTHNKLDTVLHGLISHALDIAKARIS